MGNEGLGIGRKMNPGSKKGVAGAGSWADGLDQAERSSKSGIRIQRGKKEVKGHARGAAGKRDQDGDSRILEDNFLSGNVKEDKVKIWCGTGEQITAGRKLAVQALLLRRKLGAGNFDAVGQCPLPDGKSAGDQDEISGIGGKLCRVHLAGRDVKEDAQRIFDQDGYTRQ